MNQLWVRLSIAFSAVIFVGVLLINLTTVVLVRSGTITPLIERSFADSDGISRLLSEHYLRQGNWDDIGEILILYNRLLPDVGGQTTLYLTLTDEVGTVIYDPTGSSLNIRRSPDELEEGHPITVDGRVRGYLFLERLVIDDAPSLASFAPIPYQFISTVLISFVSIAGVAGIMVGVLVSRGMTAPLARLGESIRSFGRENLGQRITVEGTSEIQALAQAFNDMAGELEQTDRLQRQFLADVSHELRTPLSVLRANLQAIQDGIYEASPQEIQSLLDQTAFLHKLVEDLHQLAKADTHQLVLDRSPTNINDLLQSVVAHFQATGAQKQVRIELVQPDEPTVVNVDRTRLSQVIHNLLQNAINHSEPHTTVEVTAVQRPSGVEITVHDEGAGIPEDQLPYIFNRFYRTDESRSRLTGGTGLGLAIAKAIVDLHGGSISVEMNTDRTNVGVIFNIFLPHDRQQQTV